MLNINYIDALLKEFIFHNDIKTIHYGYEQPMNQNNQNIYPLIWVRYPINRSINNNNITLTLDISILYNATNDININVNNIIKWAQDKSFLLYNFLVKKQLNITNWNELSEGYNGNDSYAGLMISLTIVTNKDKCLPNAFNETDINLLFQTDFNNFISFYELNGYYELPNANWEGWEIINPTDPILQLFYKGNYNPNNSMNSWILIYDKSNSYYELYKSYVYLELYPTDYINNNSQLSDLALKDKYKRLIYNV